MRVHPDPAGVAGTGFALAKGAAARRLLVINSDRDFLECADEVGKALDYQVRSSSRAGDFVALYEDFAPTVIIFDFFSASMDGIELMNWLRERRSDAHLLLTSARASFLLDFAQELAEARGFDNLELMVEPADAQELGNLLCRHLTIDTAVAETPLGARSE